jgi:signal transduction histidine kinase
MTQLSAAQNQAASAPRTGPTARDRRIWLLIAGLWLIATALTMGPVRGLSPPEITTPLPWVGLAIGFFLAESAVIHLQFRRDAHSFSMSEVPLILGLVFYPPLSLITAQLVGYFFALVVRRRQRPVKAAFNLAQFSIQALVALFVFRAISPMSATVGARTALGAVVAGLCALLVAHLLIVAAIFITGGTESFKETVQVLGLSALGTIMNSLLALGATVIMSEAPQVAWLGLAPPLLLFVAYDAYTGQRAERARISALFEATKILHRTPQLEAAIEAAGDLALGLVKAETVHVVLFGPEDPGTHFVSTIDRDDRRIMGPVFFDSRVGSWAELRAGQQPMVVPAEAYDLSDAIPSVSGTMIVTVLAVENDVHGVLLACNRMGDVSDFGTEDARLLATLASQLGVSLENGRLTDNLTEVRMLKSQLEDLVKSKDQLIASVSHELRTPLTGVVGLAQVLESTLDETADLESREILGMIVSQGVELSNIIDDLLVQAKAGNGTLQVFPTEVDLMTEISAVVATSSIPATPIAATADSPLVWADPLRLRQVVRNLLTNAVRYGGPNVRVEVVTAGAGAEVRVCDDGAGVPAAMAEAIFEPYRSAHTVATQPGSVGLGLPVSRTIARLMDGDLTYRRHRGETVFTFSLPRAESGAHKLPTR